MNLIEEYCEYDTDVTNSSQTNNMSVSSSSPYLNKTLREIELLFKSEESLPDTPYYDLPTDFNEATERKRAESSLLNERIDTCLNYFYKEMNETAYEHGMKSSNFAVAHGMHHFNNFSSAFDMARLSKVAL